MINQGGRQLDDSDDCVFVFDCPNGEILKVGVYKKRLGLITAIG